MKAESDRIIWSWEGQEVRVGYDRLGALAACPAATVASGWTVADNIEYGPSQRGVSLPAEQIATLLQRVGLSRYQKRDVSNLSGGEAQRVSIARTLANAPEVVLLDEPTSALDEESARGVEDLVIDIIRERRMTCVIVTHNNSQARRLADRTMIIEDGKLVAIGPTNEVLKDG